MSLLSQHNIFSTNSHWTWLSTVAVNSPHINWALIIVTYCQILEEWLWGIGFSRKLSLLCWVTGFFPFQNMLFFSVKKSHCIMFMKLSQLLSNFIHHAYILIYLYTYINVIFPYKCCYTLPFKSLGSLRNVHVFERKAKTIVH